MNGLLIYRSSAGSGKTYTLVKEYLKIVLKNPSEYRHILAITFTNKATSEMKSRITEALANLSEGKAEQLCDSLQEETGLSKEDIIQKAGIILEKVLHDYSSFSVSTIDSFFQKIIRSLSKEMNLPLKYDVEINRDKVIEDITEKLLQDTGKDEELTQWLLKYIIYRLDDNKSLNIEEEIYSLAAELFREDFYESMNNQGKDGITTEAFIKEMQKIKGTFEAQMKRWGQEGLHIIANAGLKIDDFSHGKSGVASYFNKITGSPSFKIYKPGDRILDVISGKSGWASKSSLKKDELETIGNERLFPILSDAVSHVQKHAKEYSTASEILKLFYVYGIVHKLKEKLNHYRKENKIILISDTENLLKKFINGNDTPFVFEKTGNHFHHFLLDEFQDTSDSQWNNLLPLLKNSLSENKFSLIVGDVKQSIYRWRNGNMELLLYKAEEDLNTFKEDIKKENLSQNFRSKKNIVEFNNSFFTKAAEIIKGNGVDEKLMSAYTEEGVIQTVVERHNEGGHVHITFVQAEKDENNKTIASWKDIALKKTLSHIQNLEEKNYALKDIAIMVRNNSEAIQITEFLAKNGYTKIISPASLLLTKSPRVQLLIHTIKYLLKPENVLAGTFVNYYYNQHLSENHNENIHEVLTWIDKGIEKNIDEQHFLPKAIYEQLQTLTNLPLFDLTESLIRIFNLRKGNDAYLQRFQDVCLDFMSSKSPHAAEFIDWWDHDMNEENSAVIVPQNENAITIITIHKAKGLQYPVVIMPFLDWDLSPKTGQVMWFSTEEPNFDAFPMYPLQSGNALNETFFAEDYRKEETRHYLDNLNLLYVAFTRPEIAFYAICPSSAGEKKVSQLIWQTLQDTRPEEITTHAMESSFIVGEIASNTKEKPIEIAEDIYRQKNYTPWQNRISIRCNHARIWNPEAKESGILEKINFGLLIHEILASVRVKSDVPHAIEKLFFEGILSIEDKNALQKKIEDLLSIEAIGKWFEPGIQVRTEKEIFLPQSGSIRPDRVIIEGKKAIVIDYKTGKPCKEDEEQVINYSRALAEMGFEKIEKYIIYIADKKIVTIHEEAA